MKGLSGVGSTDVEAAHSSRAITTTLTALGDSSGHAVDSDDAVAASATAQSAEQAERAERLAHLVSATEASSHPRFRGHAWIRPYVRSLLSADFLSAGIATSVAFWARLPGTDHDIALDNHRILITVLFPLGWLLALALADGYDTRILGIGPDEFQRVLKALVICVAGVGFWSYLMQGHVAREHVVLALPMVAVLSIGGRYLVRKRLHKARVRGEVRTSVVAVGDAESVADLARRVHAEKWVGLRVVGACIPRRQLTDPDSVKLLADVGVTPLGELDSVVTAVTRARADMVAVTSSQEMTPHRLRELSWQMERIDSDLVVAPGLIEVAGPRLHIRPLPGLPLLQVEKPEFTGVRRVVKGLVDRALGLLGVLVLSPLLGAVWLVVRMTSAGPAFFQQVRVGRHGEEFVIWKFRSMFVDAEARRAEFEAQNESSDGLLFKIRNDPRVTPVGRVIRRFSLDELPQLFNVVNGTMSLVGPRPPLPQEVAKYGLDVRRRLLVRPGVTGLWQVSGRSDLSWEESVRLDLRYVENWSLGQDALILWKTASAVLRGSGAY